MQKGNNCGRSEPQVRDKTLPYWHSTCQGYRAAAVPTRWQDKVRAVIMVERQVQLERDHYE
jgi:hypothetical protein